MGQRMSLAARAILPAFLLVLVACHPSNGSGETTASPDAIAEIEGHAVTLSAFNAYVASITPAGADETAEPDQAELMSRLLDRFIDEELIARRAAKEGMTVTEREVNESLRDLQRPDGVAAERPEDGHEPDEPSMPPSARERARRALLVRKFRQEKILKDLSVESSEIAAWYEAHKDEFNQTAHVVLRQILLEDESAARQVREELMKDPNRFEEIARASSMAPDGGRARPYDEADLSPAIVTAAGAVPTGGITEVVTDPMGSRVFKVEKRQPARVVDLAEASDRIRVTLLQEKGKKKYNAYMDSLRQKAGLVLHEERLPFTYRKRAA
ncbi:MAG: peptidyl-prolyl cis-trans isomerase [Acidobacteria bacterium]|nr:peptidyl-prolyl cis-trans isomerase [Acidobacteriota bacterium]